ncbi:copper homeostasis periplasmic binding protein CopC [Bosea sp. RCC_152_1]|uniref:copper homeostasis periplasmic binding protein CopC n=1 Tax=Bosea sp. RCC_152_1 TaxID=3239228 RepID=UPI0035258138
MVTSRLTRRESGFAALAAILAGGVPRPAWAHAHLAAASPAVDSTVRGAPREVSITFTEKLEGKLSSIAVKDSAGRPVDAGNSALADASGKKLAVGLRSDIGTGKYTVSWVAVSVDTHRTTGSFGFTVSG